MIQWQNQGLFSKKCSFLAGTEGSGACQIFFQIFHTILGLVENWTEIRLYYFPYFIESSAPVKTTKKYYTKRGWPKKCNKLS